MGWGVALLIIIVLVVYLSQRRCEKCGGVMKDVTREMDMEYWYKCKKCGYMTTRCG